jgi:hypothetical protein
MQPAPVVEFALRRRRLSLCGYVAVSVAVTRGRPRTSLVGFLQQLCGWQACEARWQPRSVPQGRSRPEERSRGRQRSPKPVWCATTHGDRHGLDCRFPLVLFAVSGAVRRGDAWSADGSFPPTAWAFHAGAAVRFGPGSARKRPHARPEGRAAAGGPRSGAPLIDVEKSLIRWCRTVSHGVDLLVSRVLGY